MNKSSVMLMVSCLLAGVRGVAGDLTVEGSLNVTSNLTAGNISATNAAVGSLAVSGGAVITGPIQGNGSGLTNVPGSALVPGSVGTNRAVAAEWNAWGDGRYMSATGTADLVMKPGRTVAGSGVYLTNIVASAYGAEQRGFNSGTQTIAVAANGAEQRGYNSGVQIISSAARGAGQRGSNSGVMVIGSSAYGAEQRGNLAAGSVATNVGKGSVQLLSLTSGQTAYMKGNAALGLGACTVTNDQSIVAGDGLASHGNGTITAVRFYGDGSGITNFSAATLQTNSITADKLSVASVSTVAIATGAVTAEKLAADAVTSEKIQNGAILDADVAPDAAIAQTKIAGLTNVVSALVSHLAAFDNPHHVTATQIGALTSETDAAALAALSSNRVYSVFSSANTNQWTDGDGAVWRIDAVTNTYVGWSVELTNTITILGEAIPPGITPWPGIPYPLWTNSALSLTAMVTNTPVGSSQNMVVWYYYRSGSQAPHEVHFSSPAEESTAGWYSNYHSSLSEAGAAERTLLGNDDVSGFFSSRVFLRYGTNQVIGVTTTRVDTVIYKSQLSGLTNGFATPEDVIALFADAAANLLATDGDGSRLTGITAAQVGAYTTNQTDSAIAQAFANVPFGNAVGTNHTGDVTISGSLSAGAFAGNGFNITNLNLAAYAGANLAWDAVSNRLNAAAGGSGYTDANAVAAVTAGNLDMNANHVTGLADATADTDAVNRRTATNIVQAAIQQALLNVGPFGDVSMGTFTTP